MDFGLGTGFWGQRVTDFIVISVWQFRFGDCGLVPDLSERSHAVQIKKVDEFFITGVVLCRWIAANLLFL